LIRPEDVILGEAVPAEVSVNRFQGLVTNVVFLGEATEYVVRIGSVEIIARNVSEKLAAAKTVDVWFPPEKTLAVAGS
jgi:ABC-type Fe3+/spermidine/putrescine transport system ATPase subunit